MIDIIKKRYKDKISKIVIIIIKNLMRNLMISLFLILQKIKSKLNKIIILINM